MQVLEAQKRDRIPDETLMAWFTTFKNNGWTDKQLKEQVDKILKTVTYGAVKIDDFFNIDEKITIQESELRAKRYYMNKVAEAEKLLRGQEFEVQLPEVMLSQEQLKLAVARRLRTYYLIEVDEKANEIISEAVQIAAEKIGFKKIEYQKDTLTNGQRLKKKWDM